MFDRVAGRYDALNSVMTAGLHHRWRERAADRAELSAGRLGPRRLLRHRRPRARAGRPGRPGRPRRRLRLLRADARPRPREGQRARRRRRPLRVGRRAQPSLRRRPLRRGHGRLRRPQPRRPRARPAGDGPRPAPGRPPGRARDHPADAAAALDLLLALVRPHRAAARQLLRRPRGLHLPARVGAQLPRSAPPGGDDGRAPAWSRSAGPFSPGGSSRSTAASVG